MSSSILLWTPGPWEIIVIALIVLLLFGGKKIPELMRGLGKGVKEFKEAQKDEDNKTKKEEENNNKEDKN